MTSATHVSTHPTAVPAWGAVFAMALCVSVLIASEFMPVSLLTPIARDLGLTEGEAGQAISISGVFAVITSLSIAAVAARMDRRFMLMGMSALLILSGLMVGLAPNFMVLMAGRALLGVAVGGFWSMSAATVMRLVPVESVPRGLAIIYGGSSLASTIAAPFGSFLGDFVGWRGAFLLVVPLAIAALVWQWLTLPSLPAREKTTSHSVLALLRKREVMFGMTAVLLVFMGQFSLFTYLRPFLESVTGVSVSMLSVLLLIVGVAGVVGTSFVGGILRTRLHAALVAIPAGMAAVAVALALFGRSIGATGVFLAIWGVVAGVAPVAWSTWLTRTLPDEAELGGGLMVAIIQLAITVGATAGGLIFDAKGPVFEFSSSAVVLGLAAGLAFVSTRAQRRRVPSGHAVGTARSCKGCTA